MKNSFDNILNKLQDNIKILQEDIKEDILNSTNKIKNQKNYESEEPMLSKNPIYCGSCNRELLYTKLEKSKNINWNTL